MTPDVIPNESEISDSVIIEASNGGGHVGFIEGGHPFKPKYYLPKRIIGFLDDCLEATDHRRPALPGL